MIRTVRPLPTVTPRRWGGLFRFAANCVHLLTLALLACSTACSSAAERPTAIEPSASPSPFSSLRTERTEQTARSDLTQTARFEANRDTPARQEQTPTDTRPSRTTPSSTATQPGPTPTPTLSPPTLTATDTLTVTPTPPVLPLYTTRLLRAGVTPRSYLTDACEVLRLRWSIESSSPGAVVVPMMFHSIVKADTVSDPKDITAAQFQDFAATAHYMGYETITTAQLLDFLEHNAPIPPLAMILIVDDRRPGLLAEHFMPVLEANNWTVTPAYIADPNTFGWAMTWMEQLNATGRLDVQSHGYSGQLYIVDETPAEQIRAEIISSTVVLEQHFGQRPLAFVWPGGNFSSLAVQIARQDGYRLGFTAYSRGPLMFNWVPSSEIEQAIGDPLMTLPRFWSTDLTVALNLGMQIGAAAREAARQSYPDEAQYYQAYCGGELPALEAIIPATQAP